MRWTAGDRVTLRGEHGEWAVNRSSQEYAMGKPAVEIQRPDGGPPVWVYAEHLSPVDPPLPPEPPVGSVVWAWGHYWRRGPLGWTPTAPSPVWRDWKDLLAADAVPLIPATKVADWIDQNCDLGDGEHFLAEFGGFHA